MDIWYVGVTRLLLGDAPEDILGVDNPDAELIGEATDGGSCCCPIVKLVCLEIGLGAGILLVDCLLEPGDNNDGDFRLAAERVC